MPTFTPLEVSVTAKKVCCVLDVPLALSPWGLLFALRLADEMNVWLVRSLWQILDSRDFYAELLLAPRNGRYVSWGARQREQLRLAEAVRQWDWPGSTVISRDCISTGLATPVTRH